MKKSRSIGKLLLKALLGVVFLANVGGMDSVGGNVLALLLGLGMLAWAAWPLLPRKARKKTKTTAPAKPVAAAPAKPRIKNMFLPSRLEGQPLAYNYRMDIVPAEGVDIVNDVLVDSEKAFPVDSDGDCITILADGKPVAKIFNEKRAEMVSDWLKKGRPVHAILLASGDKAQLRFYDDPRPRNSFREQTVAELTGYKSEAMQEVSAFLTEGDPLKLEEGDTSPDKLYVWANGEVIGRLPSKLEARAKEEDPWGLFIEEVKEEENDDGDTIYHPVVRIFW